MVLTLTKRSSRIDTGTPSILDLSWNLSPRALRLANRCSPLAGSGGLGRCPQRPQKPRHGLAKFAPALKAPFHCFAALLIRTLRSKN
jgi:hypothetical protein